MMRRPVILVFFGLFALTGSARADLIVIDFGTQSLGSIDFYEEDAMEFLAVDNGLGNINHFDIEAHDAGNAALALHGGDGESFNAEEVLVESRSPRFSLIQFGAETDDANVWEVVSSTGGQFTIPVGQAFYDKSDFGDGFEDVEWIAFRSNQIPLESLEFNFGLDDVTFAVPEPEPYAALAVGFLFAAVLAGRQRRLQRLRPAPAIAHSGQDRATRKPTP